jgi:hypothetical protein
VPRRYILDQKSAEWVAKHSKMRNGTHSKRGSQFYEEAPQTIPFYNDAGETIPAYAIVRIQGAVDAHGRDVLKAKKPGVSDAVPGSSFMANGSLSVEAGKHGLLQVGPLVRVVYDSGDSPSVRSWYGVDGFKARSYPGGKPYTQVLIEDVVDASDKIAWARIVPFHTLMIKAPAGGIPGRVGTLMGSASCAVWVSNTSNAQLSDSTLTLTVFNWARSAACATGDRYGLASVIDGRWRIVAEDCNDGGSVLAAASSASTATDVSNPIASETVINAAMAGTFAEVRYSGAGIGTGFN